MNIHGVSCLKPTSTSHQIINLFDDLLKRQGAQYVIDKVHVLGSGPQPGGVMKASQFFSAVIMSDRSWELQITAWGHWD